MSLSCLIQSQTFSYIPTVALKGLHGLAFGLQDEVLVKVTPTKQFALFIRSLLLHIPDVNQLSLSVFTSVYYHFVSSSGLPIPKVLLAFAL